MIRTRTYSSVGTSSVAKRRGSTRADGESCRVRSHRDYCKQLCKDGYQLSKQN
ncbi:unnamed protein product [Spodoptera exigua]|nr:unnamed protein product [Spodoptera exigua]